MPLTGQVPAPSSVVSQASAVSHESQSSDGDMRISWKVNRDLAASGTRQAKQEGVTGSKIRVEDLYSDVISLTRQAGAHAKLYQKQPLEVSLKGMTDPVTKGDKETEKFITTWVRERFPDHGILAEESGKNHLWEAAPYRWVIDPIDGTTNYMRGHPFWAVLIAVQEKDPAGQFQTVAAAVFAPVENALFSAYRGGGAFLNGSRITVSKKDTLVSSLLATDFGYNDKGEDNSAQVEGRQSNGPSYARLREKCQNVHVTGSSGLNLAYVAAGRYDAFWHRDLKPWDMAAGALLVEEAGGKVTNLFSNKFSILTKDIIASNGVIHQVTHENLN